MRRWLIGGAVAIPVIALGWWLGSPLFLDTVTDEAFPYARNASVPDSMTMEEVEDVMTAAASEQQTVTEAMPSDDSPQVVRVGAFRDADSFHRGSGSATIYRLPDGVHVLRLEDFMVTNGPDLRVLLANHPDPQSRGDVQESYVELAPLKGNIGNQNYEIPSTVDIEQHRSVVIYCRPFHVVFSVAPLAPPAS